MTLVRIARALGVAPAALWELSVPEVQALAKARRRTLAKRLHPDLVGGDGARMAELNAVVDWLLRLDPAALRPPVRIVRQRRGWTVTVTTSTSTTGTSTAQSGFGW
jgi:hypothetical protein